jgi:hypothetical protein
VTAQTGRTFQAKSRFRNGLPANRDRGRKYQAKSPVRKPLFASQPRKGARSPVVHGGVSSVAVGHFTSPSERYFSNGAKPRFFDQECGRRNQGGKMQAGRRKKEAVPAGREAAHKTRRMIRN